MSAASKKMIGVVWGFIVGLINAYIIFVLIKGDGTESLSDVFIAFSDADWSWWLFLIIILFVPPVIGFITAAFDNELWKILLKPFLSIVVNIVFFIFAAIVGLFLYGGIAKIIVALLFIGAIVGKGEEIVAIIVEL